MVAEAPLGHAASTGHLFYRHPQPHPPDMLPTLLCQKYIKTYTPLFYHLFHATPSLAAMLPTLYHLVHMPLTVILFACRPP